MSFDARDILEANHDLLQEAAALEEPEPAVLITLATWGRGADPDLLKALQPYRHGLGFNGSIVARVPREFALSHLPPGVVESLDQAGPDTLPVCAGVTKDWTVEHWPR